MKMTTKHLNDEHMRMYEWSGLGHHAAGSIPARPKRAHTWHASYSVLAVLTTLLILNGCDTQTAAEQASERVGQAVEATPPQPLFDDADTQPAPAEAAAPAAAESMGEPAQAGTSGPAAENAGQTGEAPRQP